MPNLKNSEYNFKKIEKKWKDKWEADKLYQPNLEKAEKPFYNLMMFPYPSAEGLHIGGVYTFTGVDTFGRYKKMQGYDVFEPIGLDGFGIHSENYAMKIGEHIKEVSQRTEKTFYRQLSSIGNMYDWSRTVETYKPEYYKWTQWLFLELFKKGLAYQKKAKVNWCPWCKTVLSDEQVIQGQCERCESVVEKKELKQWFFKITDYAEKLLKNLDWIDWSEDVKTNQRNWIGKSEGARVKFQVKNKKEAVLILHGWEDNSQGGWIPETKKYLEKLGHKVLAFDAPNTEKPVFEEWFDFIDAKIQENKLENFSIIGHSMGGLLACKLAEKYSLKNLVLVAPVGPKGSENYLKQFKDKITAEEFEVFEKYQNRELDIQKVKSNSVSIQFIFGEKDPWITKEIREFYQKNFPEASSQILKGKGHISEDEGVKKCEELETLFDIDLEVFTTRPDTLFGATYMVLAPEHQLIEKFKDQVENWGEVKSYVKKAKSKSEQERKEEEKEKTGIEIKGIKAINPVNGEEIPIWIADYILAGYGTGAIMAVPAHDERDFEFAKKFDLEIRQVVAMTKEDQKFEDKWNPYYSSPGQSVNSDFLDGLKTDEAKEKMIKWLEEKNLGEKSIDYKLRDWCVSRQRYWGPPIPIIWCEACGKKEGLDGAKAIPVPEKDLPVELPDIEDFLPEGKGKGPLAKNKEFVKTTCPVCGSPAERETDVSDPFVDSAWYFLRYPSTEFDDVAISKERSKKWLPVDSYIGGKEHTVLHLLYSRFITMVLNDLGHIEFEEPYKRFFGHGLITKDGAKMSKSKGNVINPDEMIEKYGVDVVRLYLRFLGDFSQGGDWQDNGAAGMAKFVNKLWQTFFDLKGAERGIKKTQMIDKTIKVIGEDLEKLSFNTTVARYMEFVNWVRENSTDFNQEQVQKIKETLALVLAPLAPHIAEEFWFSLGNKNSIFTEKWPVYNKDNLEDDQFELVIQVNGKVRDRIKVTINITEEEAKKAGLESEKIKNYLDGREARKVIYVQGKLINIVI